MMPRSDLLWLAAANKQAGTSSQPAAGRRRSLQLAARSSRSSRLAYWLQLQLAAAGFGVAEAVSAAPPSARAHAGLVCLTI